MKSITADFSLLLTAIIWGTGFVATQYAFDSGMSTSLILLFRFSFASLTITVFIFKKIKEITKEELKMGLVAGIILFLAFYFQTFGLRFTTPSNNAFITATNVIMVPFITWVVFKKKPKLRFFLLGFTTFIGIVFLSYLPGKGLNFTKGDIYTLFCAFLFALHISYLDIVAKKVDAVKLTFLQMTFAALFSLIVFTTIGQFSIKDVNFSQGILPVLYLGLFSTLLCFFIQTKAQKYTTSTKAAIFLSTESLFGAFFSVILQLESFTINMLIGGVFILFSIFASELRIKKNQLFKSF
ncbi:MAG: DMT family transporter [Sphaerochaetaceae bacterium]|nr:DMT family transporter [Sphaerochaetaceae bacterium]